MSGGNGLSPIANLTEKQKCPAHPTKRRYQTAAEAEATAEYRTQESGVEIGAYLCPACGSYHLTRSVGGDSVILREGAFTVGDTRREPPRRLPIPEEPEPVMPGDYPTRVKVLRGWLALNPDAPLTRHQITELTGASSYTAVRRIMTAVGYHSEGRGKAAQWVPDEIAPATAPRQPETPEKAAPAPTTHPARPNAADGVLAPWVPVDHTALLDFSLRDLIDVYAAAGFQVRLQVRNPA